MATSARQDIRAGLYNLLVDYQGAHPNDLRVVAKHRPPSFTETPIAYVGHFPELVTHDSGTRTRRIAPTVVLVSAFTEAVEDNTDDLVDALHDHFSANPRRDPWQGAPWAVVQVDDGELDQPNSAGNPVWYRAVTFTFGGRNLPGIDVMEGRL